MNFEDWGIPNHCVFDMVCGKYVEFLHFYAVYIGSLPSILQLTDNIDRNTPYKADTMTIFVTFLLLAPVAL